MKKIGLVLMCIAALILTACGGKSGGTSSSEESKGGSASGLADGKWPAVIYDKYGIPEIETKGRVVFTQFEDTEGPYQYEVYYNDVTKEEMQAWVKKLQEKGFRTPKYTQERIDNGRSDSDAFLYQPGEQKDKRLRIRYDFENKMSFEYYADEPNPAFEVKQAENDDEEDVIEYNFKVSLNPMDNKVNLEGTFEDLGIKAEDFAGIPNVRSVKMSSGTNGGTIAISFFRDHQLAEGDMDLIHNKVADVLEAKGAKFVHAMTEKAYTAEQLKADKIRTYGVLNGDKKFLMMSMSETSIGDFGGGVDLRFMTSRK